MKKLFVKYKEIILYIVFGVLTTVINIVVYQLLYNLLGEEHYLISPTFIPTTVGGILSVLFAFFTNKLFVFESTSFKAKVFIREMLMFFAARLASYFIDYGIVWLTVDHFGWRYTILGFQVWKIISNVIVIIINYVFSKLFIFKKEKEEKTEEKTEE